jgi:hypothetical protein
MSAVSRDEPHRVMCDTRQKRQLEMTTARHIYVGPGRYTIAVKVIDIIGNDTMTLVSVTVG